MMSRQPSILLIALVVGALITACGGSSKSATTDGSSAAPASSVPTGPTGTKEVQEAVKVCRRLLLLGKPTLSPSEKTKLEEMCNKAASGSLPEAQTTVTYVCQHVILSTPLSGREKERDLAACKARVK